MSLNKKRIAAGAVCVLCALVSVFGLGGWKLSGKYRAVEDVFTYGTDPSLPTRHSMDAYLDRCAEYAAQLAQEARQYLDDEESIQNVLRLASSMEAATGIHGRYDAYKELTSAVEDMYSALQSAGASGETAVTTAYHDYTSARNLIKNDGYHIAADGFNDTVEAFPANMIGGLWGVKKVDTFGQ